MSLTLMIVLLVMVLVFAKGHHRRERRLERRWRRRMLEGDGGEWGWYGPAEAPMGQGALPSLRRELESQQAYVETLESRVRQLEERLDFTEQLVAGRHEEPPRT